MVCLLAGLLVNTDLLARENNAASLNAIMAEAGEITVRIYPLVVARRPMSESEIERIDEALTRLSELFYAAAPYMEEKPDSYQIGYEFISRYLEIVKTILRTSHVDYARSHLYALGEICASCHTQDTTLRTLFSGTSREAFTDDYAFAELNYITREYAQAVKYYEKYLESPGRKTELNIIQPLQRIVTIYIQVYNDPAGAIKVLKKYESYSQHTPETRIELQNWIRGLQVLQASGVSRSDTKDFKTLQRYVVEYLGETEDLSLHKQSTAQEEVQRVWLRGQLYHYLNRRPKNDEIPKILYWLAVIDHSIAYNFYFSLADLYLKQCVLKYPTHPFARRCFHEFEHYVDHTYISQGESIPPGIKLEIQQMQDALSGRPQSQ